MLPQGSVAYEAETNAKGERLIWLEHVWADKLGAMRGPGESCSDVILRLVDQSCALLETKAKQANWTQN